MLQFILRFCDVYMQMVDAWGGWSLFQTLLQTLKKIASKNGVSIPTVAVKYILDQVNLFLCYFSCFSRLIISVSITDLAFFFWYGLCNHSQQWQDQ